MSRYYNTYNIDVDKIEIYTIERKANEEIFFCRYFCKFMKIDDKICNLECEGYIKRDDLSEICEDFGYIYDKVDDKDIVVLNDDDDDDDYWYE